MKLNKTYSLKIQYKHLIFSKLAICNKFYKRNKCWNTYVYTETIFSSLFYVFPKIEYAILVTSYFTKCINQKSFLYARLSSRGVEGTMMEYETVSVNCNDHGNCPVESCHKQVVASQTKADKVIPNSFATKIKYTLSGF